MILKCIYTFTLLGCFLSTKLNSQILNVEKQRKVWDDTSTHWIGNINFSFSVQKREIPVLRFSNINNLAYSSKKHIYLFISKLSFTRVSGNAVESNGYAHLRINLWNRKKISLEIFGQVQYDQIRGLERRLLAGTAARFIAVDNDNSLLALGFGTMYEYEFWDFNGEQATTRLLKNSSYLSLTQHFSSNIYANIIVYYQIPWTLFFQFKPRIIGDTSLNFKVSNRIKLTFTYLPLCLIAKTVVAYILLINCLL